MLAYYHQVLVVDHGPWAKHDLVFGGKSLLHTYLLPFRTSTSVFRELINNRVSMRCFLESELRLVCKLAHYEHVIVIQLYATADRDGGIESRNFQFNVFIT